MNAARVLGVGNAVVGAVTALRPATLAGAAGSPDGRPDPRVVRVLGARQCAQGLVTVAVPTADVLWLGAAVDTLHATSMAPLFVTRFRRAALISASIAIVSALCARSAARD